jgi:hypothetical protein
MQEKNWILYNTLNYSEINIKITPIYYIYGNVLLNYQVYSIMQTCQQIKLSSDVFAT